MPFKSKAQARFMFAKHPAMAKRWAAHTPNMKGLPKKLADGGGVSRVAKLLLRGKDFLDPSVVRAHRERARFNPSGQPRDLAINLPNQLRKELEAALPEMFEKQAQLAVRLPTARVKNFVESGRLKNQFETGDTRGHLDDEPRRMFDKEEWEAMRGRHWRGVERRETEEELFGVPGWAAPSERPVYGYLATPGIGLGAGDGMRASGMPHYGEVKLVLDPRVKRRATWTSGDSLGYGGATPALLPSSLERPKLRSFDSVLSKRIALDALAGRSTLKDMKSPYEYYEAQMFDPVTPRDISYAMVPKGNDIFRYVEPEDLEDAAGILKEIGIPVMRRKDGGQVEDDGLGWIAPTLGGLGALGAAAVMRRPMMHGINKGYVAYKRPRVPVSMYAETLPAGARAEHPDLQAIRQRMIEREFPELADTRKPDLQGSWLDPEQGMQFNTLFRHEYPPTHGDITGYDNLRALTDAAKYSRRARQWGVPVSREVVPPFDMPQGADALMLKNVDAQRAKELGAQLSRRPGVVVAHRPGDRAVVFDTNDNPLPPEILKLVIGIRHPSEDIRYAVSTPGVDRTLVGADDWMSPQQLVPENPAGYDARIEAMIKRAKRGLR